MRNHLFRDHSRHVYFVSTVSTQSYIAQQLVHVDCTLKLFPLHVISVGGGWAPRADRNAWLESQLQRNTFLARSCGWLFTRLVPVHIKVAVNQYLPHCTNPFLLAWRLNNTHIVQFTFLADLQDTRCIPRNTGSEHS